MLSIRVVVVVVDELGMNPCYSASNNFYSSIYDKKKFTTQDRSQNFCCGESYADRMEMRCQMSAGILGITVSNVSYQTCGTSPNIINMLKI